MLQTDKRRPRWLSLAMKSTHYLGLVSDQRLLTHESAREHSGLPHLTLDRLCRSLFGTVRFCPKCSDIAPCGSTAYTAMQIVCSELVSKGTECRFDISARHNHTPSPYAHVSTVTNDPVYKGGQRRVSVFCRKTRSMRAANIGRAPLLGKREKGGTQRWKNF